MDTVKIDSVIVGSRFRKDCGNLALLKASIHKNGMLHPIVVDKNHNLIAGKRRLVAAKELGWSEVPAHIVSVDDPRLAEADENRVRLDFTPSEAAAVARYFAPKEKEKARERQGTRTDRHSGKLPEGSKSDSRDALASRVGMSGRTLEKAMKVVEAAEQEPEKYEHLVKQMDETGKVDPAYKELADDKPKKKRRSASEVSIDIAKNAYLALHPSERKVFRKWLRTVKP